MYRTSCLEILGDFAPPSSRKRRAGQGSNLVHPLNSGRYFFCQNVNPAKTQIFMGDVAWFDACFKGDLEYIQANVSKMCAKQDARPTNKAQNVWHGFTGVFYAVLGNQESALQHLLPHSASDLADFDLFGCQFKRVCLFSYALLTERFELAGLVSDYIQLEGLEFVADADGRTPLMILSKMPIDRYRAYLRDSYFLNGMLCRQTLSSRRSSVVEAFLAQDADAASVYIRELASILNKANELNVYIEFLLPDASNKCLIDHVKDAASKERHESLGKAGDGVRKSSLLNSGSPVQQLLSFLLEFYFAIQTIGQYIESIVVNKYVALDKLMDLTDQNWAHAASIMTTFAPEQIEAFRQLFQDYMTNRSITLVTHEADFSRLASPEERRDSFRTSLNRETLGSPGLANRGSNRQSIRDSGAALPRNLPSGAPGSLRRQTNATVTTRDSMSGCTFSRRDSARLSEMTQASVRSEDTMLSQEEFSRRLRKARTQDPARFLQRLSAVVGTIGGQPGDDGPLDGGADGALPPSGASRRTTFAADETRRASYMTEGLGQQPVTRLARSYAKHDEAE